MDSPKPPHPERLLDDLAAIHQLLEKDQPEPPLLTEALDALDIPLLSEIIEPGPGIAPGVPLAGKPLPYPVQPAVAPGSSALNEALQHSLATRSKLDAELRAAAQLILQDVVDDFVPQIEAELKRRLDARLDRLIQQSRS